MKVYLYENILNEKYKTFTFRKGIKASTIIKKIGYPKGHYIIIDGDTTYNYPDCKDKKFNSEFITIKLCMEGKGGIVNTLLVVVGAVLVATGYGSAIGVSLIAAGVSGFLSQLFTKTPNSPDYENSTNKAKYGVSGTSNQSNLGNCYPVVLGKSILTPPYVGNYYTTLSDNSGDGEQYLTVLLNAGYGPLKLSNFKVGDNLVANNDDDIRNGDVKIDGNFNATIQIQQDGNLPAIYQKKYYQEQIGSEIKYSTIPDDIRTSPKKVNKIRVYIKFNALYYQNKNNGNLENASVGLRVAYRKTGTESWKYATGSFFINIPEITWRSSSGISSLFTCKIYQQELKGYNFRINTSLGYRPGKYENGNVYMYIYNKWQLIKEATLVIGNIYTSNQNKTKRYYIDVDFSDEEIADNPNMQWDISVWKTTPDRDNYYQDKPYLESVLYFIDEEPVLASERKKLCLIAFRIEAGEFIQNVIDKVNFEAQSILPIWNGENWYSKAPSSNPASIYLQCLKGNYLKRKADDSQIDYDSLQKLYNFCEEHKYYCNGIISNSETLRDILTKVLNTCRSKFTIKNGQYSVIIDDYQDSPIAILSPKNSSNFKFTKDLSNKVNCINVKYQSEADDYETVEEKIYLDGESEAVDDNAISVDYWGVNNHEQIVKLCRYAIATSRLRPETYTLNVSIEHFSLPRGSRVELQHDVLMAGVQSGYIKKVNGNKITLDELLPIQEIGKNYGLKIVPRNGNEIQIIPLLHFNGQQREVVAKDLTGINIDKGDFYAYGIIDKITEDCIIVDKTIDESPSLSATLTLQRYAPEIFEAENKPIPAYQSNITTSGQFLTNLIYEGKREEISTKTVGSSVQDEGGIYFNLGNATVDKTNSIVKNLGNLASVGNAEYTCDIIYQYNYMWFKGGNGNVKFKLDNLMYRNFTLSFYFLGNSSQTKKSICYYKDLENNNIFEIFIQNGFIYLNNQDAVIKLEVDYEKYNMITITRDLDKGIMKLYLNGEYVSQIDINNIEAQYITEDGQDNFIDEDSENKFITEKYSQPILGNNRDLYFYLLSDNEGNYKIDGQITNFHLWKDILKDTDVKRLYYDGVYIQNTEAESRYLGEFDYIPTTGNLYDYFYYTGETNINFLKNNYYRQLHNGWELYKIFEESQLSQI